MPGSGHLISGQTLYLKNRDGRTVDVRIVPYGRTARVSDGGPLYEEQWMPGVFAHQVNAANRVLANFEHQSGIGGVVGHEVNKSK